MLCMRMSWVIRVGLASCLKNRFGHYPLAAWLGCGDDETEILNLLKGTKK